MFLSTFFKIQLVPWYVSRIFSTPPQLSSTSRAHWPNTTYYPSARNPPLSAHVPHTGTRSSCSAWSQGIVPILIQASFLLVFPCSLHPLFSSSSPHTQVPHPHLRCLLKPRRTPRPPLRNSSRSGAHRTGHDGDVGVSRAGAKGNPRTNHCVLGRQ